MLLNFHEKFQTNLPKNESSGMTKNIEILIVFLKLVVNSYQSWVGGCLCVCVCVRVCVRVYVCIYYT